MPTPGNSINEATTGISGFTGTAFTGTAVTQFNVLVGGSTSSTLSNVAPSATSGVPLISQGSSSNPVFGTAVVAGGGTGDTSFTAYAVVCGGTTSTNPLQSIASVGTSPQVLTSNGAAALPTFQNVSASGAITTITGNSGGAESPSSGNFNILGTGSITVAGSANTETVQLTGLTNHNVLVGAGTATITNVAPSATSGIPLVSNGSSADPSFTTAVVAGGGTGVTSFSNTSALIASGTTTTGNLQNIASVATGQVLTSAGTSTLPAWSAAPSVTSITLSGGSTLSTYVTGTFTPGLSFGNASVGITYAGQVGFYTQIGNIVHIHGEINLSSKGSSTGTARLTGLPVSTGTNGNTNFFTIVSTSVTLTASYTTIALQPESSTTTALIIQSGSGQILNVITDTGFANSSSIYYGGFYSTQ